MPRQPADPPARFELAGYWLSQRRGSAQWCRTWFDPASRQTKRASLGTADFQQAQLALARWVVTSGDMRDARPADVPLETVLLRYWEHQASPLRSADQARYALKRWSDFFAGATVQEVTIERQRDFVAALEAEGLSGGYIRRILANGQAAINRALKHQEIAHAPAIDLDLAPEGEARDGRLGLPAMAALFRATTLPHQRLYLLFAVATLARPEAILQLEDSQCDVALQAIRLNPPGRRQTRKRRPTLPMLTTMIEICRHLPPGPVVTYAGRTLKLFRTPWRRLAARAAAQLRQDAAARARDLRAAGDAQAAWEALRQARRSAQELVDSSPYTIRHQLAVELRARGVPKWEVEGWLGHRSGSKTTERYASVGPDVLPAARAALDTYLAELAAELGPSWDWLAWTGLRVSRVLVARGRVVEPRGIEPLTSTMPLGRSVRRINGLE